MVITSERCFKGSETRAQCYFSDESCREELESATHRLNAHVTELTQRLCKTEVSLQANIHDYLSLRAETLQSTRHMQEQLVAANTTRDEALIKLTEMQVQPQLHVAHHPHKSHTLLLFFRHFFMVVPFHSSMAAQRRG